VDTSLKKVLQNVNEQETVDFIKELIKVDTVMTEVPIVPVITEKMRKIGMEVEVYDTCDPRFPDNKRPSILGTLHGKSGRPLLCFNGHMDVVPVEDKMRWSRSPFDPVVEKGRLYGRGACDMKGGLGAMIMAAQAIADSGVRLRGSLVIAAVPGEETGGWGTESMARRKNWDAAVIGEPTQLSINPACNGITTFWIRVGGRSAHASMPERGVNAIDKMLKVLNALEEYKKRLAKRVHPLTGTPAFVSCIIKGGWRSVIVADECRLHITTHLIPGETTRSRLSEVNEILEELKLKDPQLETQILDWKEETLTLPLPETGPGRPRLDPTEISVDEPVVQAVVRGARESLGKDLPINGSRYACDSPYFVNDEKVPALVFGPGSIDQAHTYDEWIEVKQLVDAVKVYAATAAIFLG
jgi:acetylornithine deacetylase/succinyl-diaminopimelate desuccinylase family protein